MIQIERQDQDNMIKLTRTSLTRTDKLDTINGQNCTR